MSNDELYQIMEKVHKEEDYWQVHELASRLVSEDGLKSHRNSLDNDVLEVYAGVQSKENATSKRFNDVGSEDDMVPALVKSFCFTELPTEEEFIAALSFE
jgi:hypothetical protein